MLIIVLEIMLMSVAACGRSSHNSNGVSPFLAIAFSDSSFSTRHHSRHHRQNDDRRDSEAHRLNDDERDRRILELALGAVVDLRGGSDASTEMAFPEGGGGGGDESTSVDESGRAADASSSSDNSRLLPGIGEPQQKPKIETVFVHKPPHHHHGVGEAEGRREDDASSRKRVLPPSLSMIDKVPPLPSDSSYVPSPAQLTAFIKRGTSASAGAGMNGGVTPPASSSEHQPLYGHPVETNHDDAGVDDASSSSDNANAVMGLQHRRARQLRKAPSSGGFVPTPADSTSSSSSSSLSSSVAALPRRGVMSPVAFVISRFLLLALHPVVACYAAALLGTAVGFVQFLYFSTIGYATGVALPVAFQTVWMMILGGGGSRRGGGLQTEQQPSALLLLPSILSSGLVVLWGIRLGAFLLWREHVNWPALHARMQLVSAPPLVPTQILGWAVYSALYLCVASPVLFQNHHSHQAWLARRNRTASSSEGQPAPAKVRVSVSATPGVFAVRRPYSRVALALQVVGLVLETVADLQKSLFKAKYRHDWCNVGVWRYSTHPNYLGEALFWIGTHWNGLVHLLATTPTTGTARSVIVSIAQLAASGAGLSFVLAVLHGAVLYSQETQARKYGTDPLYISFQEKYGVAGYRLWKNIIHPFLAQHAGGMINAPETPSSPPAV
jgi:steroid 5-alpha reductase family enzyme